MAAVVGNDTAQAAFLAAMRGGSLHHAWLIAGPEGVGKATFARAAAIRMLAEGVDTGVLPDGFDVPAEHPARKLVEAGSHPDFRAMERLPKDIDKPEQGTARSITIAQVRALQPLFATAPSMSRRRVVLIDAIDDLERPGASNALLKNLEEPPAGTIFLLVSHTPGRLLPTVRSRCRLLRFAALDDADTARVIQVNQPDATASDVAALVAACGGAPGLATRYAGLDIAGIDSAIASIARDGDRDNAHRVRLARALALKAAQPRYEAFLERAPAFIAHTARKRSGPALRSALDAHAAARELARAALGLSLDAQATVFEMARLVAGLKE